jgi:excisionase family DNA binding protein
MIALKDANEEEPALNERESVLVRSAQRCIMTALDHSRAGKIALLSDSEAAIDKDTPILELPPKVLRFIAKTLGAMAEGKIILLMPREQELTTVQAAHLLQVSRPFLSKLLKEGKIPFRMVGSHRRVSHEDLMSYKAKMREAQDLAMQELTDQSQEMGIE